MNKDDRDRDTPLREFDAAGAPMSRRTLLKGSTSAVLAVAASGLGLEGCRTSESSVPAGQAAGIPAGQTAEYNTARVPPGTQVPGGPVLGYDTLGGVYPQYRPLGLRSELDRNEYFHNMTVHATLETDRGTGGVDDGCMCPLWVRGERRLLKSGVDITDPLKPFVAQDRFPGGWLFYASHLKKWVCFQSVSGGMCNPNHEYPWGHYAGPDAPPRSSKQFHDVIAASKGKFRGLRSFDVTDPSKPVQLGEYKSGGDDTIFGHGHFWDGGRYMYLMNNWDTSLREATSYCYYGAGVGIIDVWDPANIKDVAKWWVPGQKFDEEEEWAKWPFAGMKMAWCQAHGGPFVPRRVEDGGKYGYAGMGHFGLYTLDLTDITKPTPVGHVKHPLECNFGSIPHHTQLTIETGQANPTLLITVDEELITDGRGPWHASYIVDIKDPRNPKIIGLFPRPLPPKEAPYADFAFSRGRFGSHNSMSWCPPGRGRADITALTHFGAGVRVYDIRDPREPKEVAWWVPARSGVFTDEEFGTWYREEPSAFIEWDRNLIWMSDRKKIICCSTPMLGKPILEPRKVEQWAVAHVNRGWDDQMPKSVYLGRSLSQMT